MHGSVETIMKLLVTGGTGFIGGHFLDAAIRADHRVTALRRPGSPARRPPPGDVMWLEKPWSELTPSDVAGCDVLLHFSSRGVSPGTITHASAFEHNVMDQLRLLSICVEAGIPRAVLCGTCMEYGLEAARHEFIPPSAPLSPVGPYAASKAAGGLAAMSLCRDAKIECAYLRVFSAFGEGQNPEAIWPSLRLAAISGRDFPMTSGTQVRDFIPVSDVAAHFLKVAVQHRLEPGIPEVHNVGSGSTTTVLDFATHWWNTWGARGRLLPGALPHRPDEPMRYVPLLTL